MPPRPGPWRGASASGPSLAYAQVVLGAARNVLALLFGLLVLAGVAMLFIGGLLIGPVSVLATPGCLAEGVSRPCVRASCLFENQGPVPTRGSVVIDVWTTDPADAVGARRIAAGRRTATLSLAPRERVPVVYDYPGVPYSPGHTMVRCMPWYAAPRLEEKLVFTPWGG